MKKRPRRIGRIHAIVPVNILRKSKARLSRLLNPSEREKLTASMLKDVLSALTRSRRIRWVTVVSADRSVGKISRHFSASFLWEGKRRGLNKAVRMAIHQSQNKGAGAVLIVHADLPLLKAREVDRFLEQAKAYSVAVAPSSDGRGTNALFMNPPQAIPPVFGKESFRRHLALAKKMDASVKIIRRKGLSFDVDAPQDLAKLMRRPLRNETGQFLRAFRDKG